ncbi:hypothetical protein [Nocardioides sp. L-11A]|uniref:hypothetical protein n=1 Tax=Nocardioides sp. L-11A TaxID=3043848 RepID=UPI00249C107A|nr:hypothetical protein QJ852_03625 [Nocardioides sp. L-11A]
MASTLSSLRRALGLRSGRRHDAPRSRGGDAPGQPVFVVPVTVRDRTDDDADIRLLLEAKLSSATLPRAEVDRIALALVVPAAGAWVRRQRLAALEDSLGPRLREVEEGVCHQTRALGADLLSVEVVAVEHLLVSPSADADQGGEHGDR